MRQLSACAHIHGNKAIPKLSGTALFYTDNEQGIWIEVEIWGLPEYSDCHFFGMHIHEFGDCSASFENTGNHYNPDQRPHPSHAGDLPPLLGCNGYAYSRFFTNRFSIDEIINRSLVIHSQPDDFTTQPSGNSGEKIGCGVIHSCFSINSNP